MLTINNEVGEFHWNSPKRIMIFKRWERKEEEKEIMRKVERCDDDFFRVVDKSSA